MERIPDLSKSNSDTNNSNLNSNWIFKNPKSFLSQINSKLCDHVGLSLMIISSSTFIIAVVHLKLYIHMLYDKRKLLIISSPKFIQSINLNKRKSHKSRWLIPD